MSLVVFCPTRGRPDKARETFKTFLATKHNLDTIIVFVVDQDDPKLADYVATTLDGSPLPVISPAHSGGMAAALNAAAKKRLRTADYVGFVGDDHRFRTPNWDLTIIDGLIEIRGGIAYANDLLQSQNLPTQVFMDAVIVRALGWMALPGAKHLYLDNAWKDIGGAIGRLRYFPNVIIEHLHPAAQKAEWDEGYLRVNSPEYYHHDEAIYQHWRATEFERDVKRVRTLLDDHRRDGGVE